MLTRKGNKIRAKPKNQYDNISYTASKLPIHFFLSSYMRTAAYPIIPSIKSNSIIGTTPSLFCRD